MTGRLLRCGERALLVEVDDLDAVLALNDLVAGLVQRAKGPWRDVLDVVPAARTLFVTAADPDALARLRPELTALLATPVVPGGGRAAPAAAAPAAAVVEIGVHYDGPDLADVARLTGLTEADVIAAHTGRPWRVAFGGFAPGFAYLVDGDPRLDVPRRAEPRTVVPAGAVGLAGRFSGVYPRPSPGGWQLIGHTDEALWDADRTPPALLRPGVRVRFRMAGTP